MKFFFLVLFIFELTMAQATTYYVSNTGSDDADGITTGTAWQTIAKVNAQTFSPGDSVLFKCGDSWHERLEPPSSGSSGNVITFGSYGSGAKPIITGFSTITGFTDSSGIWSATAASCPKNLNTVMVDGVLRAKGRYPNTTYLTGTTFSSTTQLIVPHSATNYLGYGIVIRSAKWILDVSKITVNRQGAINDTFTLSPATTYNTPEKYYFLQNNINLLDLENEWSFDSTNYKLSVKKGSSPTVSASTIDTLVYFRKKNYLTFDGIKFTGANCFAFYFDSSRNITIQNCVLDNIGQRGVVAYYINTVNILSDTITNCLSDGIHFDADTSITCSDNYVKRIGIFEGMGINGNGTYIGFYNDGHDQTYTNNVIDSVGYHGIYFKGRRGLIQNNVVSKFGFSKQDGGGIYTFLPSLNYRDTGTLLKRNIVHSSSSNYLTGEVFGIYLDNNVTGITLDSNTIYNCGSTPLFIKGKDHTFTNNIVHHTALDMLFYSIETFINPGFNFIIKHNTFFTSTGNMLYFTGGLNTTENIDSNYYFTPYNKTPYWTNAGTLTGLPAWVAATGYDVHSSTALPGGITTSTPTMFTNPTLVDSTIVLSGGYYDQFGVGYFGSFTLAPFQSKMLWPSVYRAPTPLQKVPFKSIIQL